MARVDNPVIGTLDCKTCGEVATLHQTARSKRKGLLYKRCGCGCDQRTGAAVQKRWREQMTPRPGYEHLKEPEEPQARAVEPEPETTETKPAEPAKPEPKGKKLGSPVGAVLLALGVAIITVGAVK